MKTARGHWLYLLGPGLLVAATGVGSGDLATAAFAGNRLGSAVLWAVVIGAFFKFVLNEGLTRWQLASGDTLLEGCVTHIGRPFRWLFLPYLIVWSFLVGLALMSACGAAMHALLPLMSPQADKILYGILHSAVAVVLVQLGGYRLFERVMTACIGVMFCVVVLTAVALRPSLGEIAAGLFVPRIPHLGDGGLEWTIALLGGVGGTLTILCYGYWIREEGRQGVEDLRTCRIDLAGGYTMTALFGMAMVVIGSRMNDVEGSGVSLLANLASGLKESFGGWGWLVQWAFLIGAWATIFSSLLGVWQSIPYLFADYVQLASTPATASPRPRVDMRSPAYQAYLYGLATIPAVGLWLIQFQTAQKTYAIVGALVIPFLALVLLHLNNRASLVGSDNRNSWMSNAALGAALLFFLYAGWLGVT